MEGVARIFANGAVACIDNQTQTIRIKQDHFTAEICYKDYPDRIADWFFELAKDYEDLT